MHDLETVLRAAAGRWLDIFGRLAPNELCPALQRPGHHVACPIHGGTDGYRLFRHADQYGDGICNTCGACRDGIKTLQWVKGWTFREAIEAVAAIVLDTGHAIPADRRTGAKPASGKSSSRPSRGRRYRRFLQRLWTEAISLREPDAAPGRAYLWGRTLPLPPASAVRFHPALKYRDDSGQWCTTPGLLARIHDGDGNPATLHRTFLSEDGAKAFPGARRMMPLPDGVEVGGGAIRLARPARILAVAEGLETALAVQNVTQMPVWSVVNTALMRQFVPPQPTHTVMIWADRDRNGAGENAAQALADRLQHQGLTTCIYTPHNPIRRGDKSIDWADVLTRYGPEAFPSLRPQIHRAA